MHTEHADGDSLNDLSGQMIGCAFTVLNTLDAGFLETVRLFIRRSPIVVYPDGEWTLRRQVASDPGLSRDRRRAVAQTVVGCAKRVAIERNPAMRGSLDVTVVLEPQAEGGFTVSVPAMPEVVTEGDTEAEAMAMAEEAISAVLADRRDHRIALPDGMSLR